MKKRLILEIILASFLTVSAFCESEGEKLFKNNKPAEAVLFLEEEIKNGTASSMAYNYLGLAYYQLGDFKKAADTFAKGLTVPATNKKILAFNQGNAYYSLNDYLNAAKSYSLAYTADSKYTQALLNRANAYLMAQKYDECINDYEMYIVLEPDDPQRPQIEEILALLRKEKIRLAEEERLRAEEAARLAEEEKRMQEELERQRIEAEKKAEEERIAREKEEAERRAAEEERLAAEAERRRKLLEEVANSLQNTDSTNMSSGTEDLMDYDYESELD